MEFLSAAPRRAPRTHTVDAVSPQVDGAVDIDDEPVAVTPTEPPPPPSFQSHSSRSPPLELWLASRGLGRYSAAIRERGARKVADLMLLSNDDLDELGIPQCERVNIRIAVS